MRWRKNRQAAFAASVAGLGVLWLAASARAAAPQAAEPEPTYSPWQSKHASPFASVATDVGLIYFRPRLTLGYGAPFWNFVGLDAYWMTTNSFTAPYLGWRASLPFLDAFLGVRRTIPFNRRFMTPSDEHRANDLDLAIRGGERSVYNAIDFEVAGFAPVLHGGAFLSVHPVWVDAPSGIHLYEEVLRVVIEPPFALGLRGGYLYGIGDAQSYKLGAMLEYVVMPGRPRGVWRAGPVALATFSKNLEGLFAFSYAFDGPDKLGIFHGTYAFLGLLHRWAHRF